MASHMEIAHRWAQDRQDGKSLKGYAMFYDDNRIFSWGHHFCIARHTNDAAGRRVTLFTTDTYSVSTSKHTTYTRRALTDRNTVYYVKDVLADYEHAHKSNLADMLKKARDFIASAKRRRSEHGRDYDTRQAYWLLQHAREYAQAFAVPADMPADFDELERQAVEAAERQAVADREAAERRKVQAAEQRERDKAYFIEWQNGERDRVPLSYERDAQGACYLRRKHVEGYEHATRGYPARDELQTSQNASVPWSHAVKAFRFIKLCRESGKPFHTNGKVIRVGHYTVDWIDEHGNMKAGCHLFSWSEIERLALKEGVFNVTPSAEAVETRESVTHD